jgi:hypothetical protein
MQQQTLSGSSATPRCSYQRVIGSLPKTIQELPAQWQLAKPPRIAQVCRTRCTVPVSRRYLWRGTTDALAHHPGSVDDRLSHARAGHVLAAQTSAAKVDVSKSSNMRAGAYSSMGCRKLGDGTTHASVTRMSPLAQRERGCSCQPSSRVAIPHLLRFQHLHLGASALTVVASETADPVAL